MRILKRARVCVSACLSFCACVCFSFVCVRFYVCVYVCVYFFACVCVFFISVCAFLLACMCIFVCACFFRLCMFLFVHVYVRFTVCVRMYFFLRVSSCLCVHQHTHECVCPRSYVPVRPWLARTQGTCIRSRGPTPLPSGAGPGCLIHLDLRQGKARGESPDAANSLSSSSCLGRSCAFVCKVL